MLSMVIHVLHASLIPDNSETRTFCAQKTQQVQSWIDVYSSHELIFWEGVENKDAAMHHQHSTVHPTLYMH